MSIYRFRQAPLKINNYWSGTSVSSYFATELDINSPESLSTVQSIIESLGYEYIETNPTTQPSLWRLRSDGYYQRMPLPTATIPTIESPTSDFTAEPGGLYLINTTGGAVTVIPPSSPSIGDTFEIVDAGGLFDTNNVIIDFPSESQVLMGVSQTYIFDLSGDRKNFLYTGPTYGWVLS